MPRDERVTLKVYEGPSLVAPFATIAAEFESPSPKSLPSREILELLTELYPHLSQLVLDLADGDTDFSNLVVALMDAFQERVGPGAEPVVATHSDDGPRQRIAVRFDDLDVTKNILLVGIEVASTIFARAAGRDVDIQESSQKIRQNFSEIRALPQSRVTAVLSRVARARGIPTYPVSRRTGIYAFGQGANAFLFQEMANCQDSLVGWRLARHKAVACQLIRSLGFPTAKNKIAANADAARRIAREFGFPVVVKPPDQSKGTAVAVGITTDDELDAAFARARAASPLRQVLVERFAAGDDHRLSVYSGKLKRVFRQLPPRIVGDGKRSVAELIEAANLMRRDDSTARFYCPQLKVDKEMTALLRKQGFTLEDRPPQAHILNLRQTANLHTGGSREDVTASIHPDNVIMAETIANNFHLNAVGIDLITPDIGKAWHEVECAIIEVNTNPGTSDSDVMESILLERFPAGSDGRIPSILIVGEGTEFIDGAAQYLGAGGRRVGQTSSMRTQLAGQPRFRGTADLPGRVLSLLLDSTCEALVVACTPDEVAEYGLPHTIYDLALIAKSESLAAGIRQLIENNSSQMKEGVTMKTLDKVMRPLIPKILNES